MSEKEPHESKRIGVFVCHCGKNIADTVDVEEVAKDALSLPGVVYSNHSHYLCSEPGQKELQDDIRFNRLDSVVCACCSPTLHEETFRKACEDVGINRYEVEIANIREKCSWVHTDRRKATDKALKIIETKVEKALLNEALVPVSVEVNRNVLVVGAGITGIQTAIDMADAGFHVYLVEKSPTIGGHMAQLSTTFPTLDCSQCILSPKMSEIAHKENIELLTNTELISVSGFVGNFHVELKKNPRYVTTDCNLCGDCDDICPVIIPNEFEGGLGPRKAIYLPFPQAVPSLFTLDTENCLGIHPLVCSKCRDVCEQKAINYDMEEEIVEKNVGAIIIATGYDLYDISKIPEYEFGADIDVIDGIQFERLLNGAGPTGGEVLRPSDHKKPETVVFVQCVGSRDPEHHMAYCSKICCTYTGKHALLLKDQEPDAEVYVFYIDIRAAGRGYEEFIQRAQEKGVIYVRGKPSKIFREGDKTIVWAANTLTGERLEVEADMVVLAPAMIPSFDTKVLSSITKCSLDEYGFFKEAHVKLRPVESLVQGLFVAGAALSPKDIPESIAQGSAAAAKAIGLLSKPQLFHDPLVATVNSEICSGCKVCQSLCPYGAISFDEERKISLVKEILCQGCGTCVSACPSRALSLRNLTNQQIEKMIQTALKAEAR
ncbi:MAG TPA: CoB--CoM heterodisulfide reductase iron-sulfur subunit A family protein [candidate division Zixibacteria bacterium]|nr:CoB--CoM heterodisulfide reductase iron-sulfur subunit A family protein [candidate division Zixibacteria bacterium]